MQADTLLIPAAACSRYGAALCRTGQTSRTGRTDLVCRYNSTFTTKARKQKSTSDEVLLFLKMVVGDGLLSRRSSTLQAMSNQMIRLHSINAVHGSRRDLRHILNNKKSTSDEVLLFLRWWWEMDSNHRTRREQIYSLPPLTARQSHQE